MENLFCHNSISWFTTLPVHIKFSAAATGKLTLEITFAVFVSFSFAFFSSKSVAHYGKLSLFKNEVLLCFGKLPTGYKFIFPYSLQHHCSREVFKDCVSALSQYCSLSRQGKITSHLPD